MVQYISSETSPSNAATPLVAFVPLDGALVDLTRFPDALALPSFSSIDAYISLLRLQSSNGRMTRPASVSPSSNSHDAHRAVPVRPFGASRITYRARSYFFVSLFDLIDATRVRRKKRKRKKRKKKSKNIPGKSARTCAQRTEHPSHNQRRA
jgi:hypothetical protein